MKKTIAMMMLMGFSIPFVAQAATMTMEFGDLIIAADVQGKAETKPTWLGVVAEPAPPALRSQLGIPDGLGLLVVHVAPDSPASKGIKIHDIITKINDQKIINAEQLRTLIRSFKAEDTISITLFRHGKETTVKATLATSPYPEAMDSDGSISRPTLPSFNLGEHFKVTPDSARPRNSIRLNNSASASVVEKDDDFTYVLKVNATQEGKKTTFSITDKDGKMLFNGPVNTDEEKAAVPEQFKKKLETLMETQTNVQVFSGEVEIPGFKNNDLEKQREHIKNMQQEMEKQIQRMQEEMERMQKLNQG